MAVSSHLRVTLVYVSHLRLVGEPHTVGCLPMCCPLIHCMAAFHCEDVLCLEGFSPRSPGSWQGGFYVSALSGLFCWTPLQDLALFWCFVFASVQDLVIQWHHRPAPIGVVWSELSSLFLFFGWLFVFVWFLFCFFFSLSRGM